MKILLIHTQNVIQRFGSGVYKKHLRYAPLTMPTLAALVPRELRAEVRVVDEMVENVDLDVRPDLVGLTAITSAAPRAYELAAHFRKAGAVVVMGGIHATLLPEEALAHVDAVVRGPAETSWPQLLRDFASGTMKRVYETGATESSHRAVEPDRSFIRRSAYVAPNTLEMSRGCSKHCSFCVTPRLHEGYRTKDIPTLIEQARRLPGKLVTFLDPNLGGDVAYARRFFSEFAKLRKWWVGCVAIDILQHPDLLDLMVESGAKGFLIGFESLDQEALDQVHKSFSRVDAYHEAIEMFHRRGIMVQGNFILGFDSDHPASFDRLADFVIKTRIDLPQFTLFTPFPGTPDFDRLDREGRILHRDWSRYNGYHVVFRPKNMTPDQLAEGARRVWSRVYSLPRMARRLWGPPFLPKPVVLLSNLNFRQFMRRVHRRM